MMEYFLTLPDFRMSTRGEWALHNPGVQMIPNSRFQHRKCCLRKMPCPPAR